MMCRYDPIHSFQLYIRSYMSYRHCLDGTGLWRWIELNGGFYDTICLVLLFATEDLAVICVSGGEINLENLPFSRILCGPMFEPVCTIDG